MSRRVGIVGMHLDGEFVSGKNEFDENGEVRCGG